MTGAGRRVIGLPWYSRDDYPAVRSMMADAHVLASTYDQWRMAAENNERVAQEAGLEVMRVMIVPEEFAAWCAKRNLEPDSRARSQRAQEAVQERQQPE
jgi:hypothetical protein